MVRAGAGIFYDLGYSAIGDAMISFPYSQFNNFFNTSFPLSNTDATPPPFRTTPPVTQLTVVDPNHHYLPRTYEWNTALEQGFGSADAVTFTYVGAAGRKLMRRDIYSGLNPNFPFVEVMSNGGSSSFNSRQVQYRHRLSHGVQALASYTWAHSIDNVSSDANYANVPPRTAAASLNRGPSDYDIRHTFSAALSYDIPGPGSGALKQMFGSWSTDSIIYARSAPPVNVVTGKNAFPGTLLSGANSAQRPNVVPGVPFHLYGGQYPGGKIINSAAFTPPADNTQGDLGRNALRGFGATQWDITLRRPVPIYRKDFASIPRRFLQHPESPEFRQPRQLPQLASIRAGDSDAQQLPRQRRPERRLESALPDRRAALDSVGDEAAILRTNRRRPTGFS